MRPFRLVHRRRRSPAALSERLGTGPKEKHSSDKAAIANYILSPFISSHRKVDPVLESEHAVDVELLKGSLRTGNLDELMGKLVRVVVVDTECQRRGIPMEVRGPLVEVVIPMMEEMTMEETTELVQNTELAVNRLLEQAQPRIKDVLIGRVQEMVVAEASRRGLPPNQVLPQLDALTPERLRFGIPE